MKTRGDAAQYYSLLGLLNVAAWIVSAKLMIYDYRKSMSEGLLTHGLFWLLSLIIETVFVAHDFENYVRY
jgi:hypothetical protein